MVWMSLPGGWPQQHAGLSLARRFAMSSLTDEVSETVQSIGLDTIQNIVALCVEWSVIRGSTNLLR